jgi:hypothetical protein
MTLHPKAPGNPPRSYFMNLTQRRLGWARSYLLRLKLNSEASHHLAVRYLPFSVFRCFHWTKAFLPLKEKGSRAVRDSRYRDMLSRQAAAGLKRRVHYASPLRDAGMFGYRPSQNLAMISNFPLLTPHRYAVRFCCLDSYTRHKSTHLVKILGLKNQGPPSYSWQSSPIIKSLRTMVEIIIRPSLVHFFSHIYNFSKAKYNLLSPNATVDSQQNSSRIIIVSSRCLRETLQCKYYPLPNSLLLCQTS